jgi:hypothetical protein
MVGGRPGLSVVYEGWKMSVAPQGHAVALQHKNLLQGELIWLKTSDFSVLRESTESAPGTTLDATEDFALLSTWGPPYRTEPRTDAAPQCSLRKCQGLYILDNEVLLKNLRNAYEIVDMNGNPIMHGSLSGGIDALTRSLDGSGAAFDSGRLSIGGFTAGATNGEILVVDMVKHKDCPDIVQDAADATRFIHRWPEDRNRFVA